jgi:pyridinium-3,5-bisthiocarboxylic acid mononucleotide nickel chelatase
LRIAHFDCFSGISGDMVLGAVIDAGVPAQAISDAINSLQLPIQIEIERVKRCGFAACKVNIIAQDEESYRFLPDVEIILDKAKITESQRLLAKKIFRKLAEAEAASHGMPLERVHFHEVGALDSIADILGAAVGLDLLNVEKFTSSPVPTGCGTVKGAHGLMPIPAPGTAALLKGVPIAPSDVKFELTTPTGAAILATVVSDFTASPGMTIESIGSGAGTKDFMDRPNILRLFVGESSAQNVDKDTVVVLETNLDDISPEIIGYTTVILFAAGAYDVFTQPILMKKQRPGVLLSVICHPKKVETIENILFRETGTFGIRQSRLQRSILQREMRKVSTPWGEVRVKVGSRSQAAVISTPEYEDCASIAREHGIPLREVYEVVRQAIRSTDVAPTC